MAGLAAQESGDTGCILIQRLAEGRLAEVGIDDDDLGTLQGHGSGEIQNRKGLSCVRVEGRHHDDLGGLLRGMDHQIEVRTEDTEGLIDHIPFAGLDEDPGIGLIEPVLTERELMFLSELRNLGEERDGQTRDVTAPLDRIVQHVAEVEIGERDAETKQGGDEDDHHPVRGNRSAGAGRLLDQARIFNGQKGLKFILFPFLEKEDIELFLDFLLAVHRRKFQLLAGSRRQFGKDPVFLTDNFLALDVEGSDQVIHGPVDCDLDCIQVVVDALDHRVRLAAHRKEPVPLKQGRIVLCDLAADIPALDGHVGRNEVICMGRIIDPLLDIAGNLHLLFNLERLLGIIGRLLQHGAGVRSNIGDLVRLLIVLDVGLNPTEFPLDIAETVVDENRRFAGRCVLHLHPIFVIDIEKSAQDDFGPARIDILDRQDDDGRLLVGEACGKTSAVSFSAGAGRKPGNGDIVLPGIDLLCRDKDQFACRRVQGIFEITLEPAFRKLSRHFEVFQFIRLLACLYEGEREREYGAVARNLHLDRGIAVHLAFAEELLIDILGLQTESFHNFLHQVRRHERGQFVIDAGTGIITAVPAGKRGQVPDHRILGRLVYDEFFIPAVDLRSLIEIESRGGEADQEGKDIPSLVIPDQSQDIGQAEYLFVIQAALDLHGVIVLIILSHSKLLV